MPGKTGSADELMQVLSASDDVMPTDELVHRLSHLEGKLDVLSQQLLRVYEIVAAKVTVKDSYTTTELAHILNRRPYTVREWCRLGRVNATRTHAGRGEVEEWRVSHQELQRIQNEGLLPLKYR